MSLRGLVEHMIWADQLARDQINNMPAGSAERARAEAIYAHLAAAEHVWLSRLQGVQSRTAIWPQLAAQESAELARSTVSQLLDYAKGASRAQLDAEIAYSNSAGQEFRNRAEDILHHVALHGAYHRGQLALLARLAGSTPVSTDYIAYLRGAPAPRRD